MVTIILIFIVGSFLASVMIIAAGMLSSRLGESQMMVEEYQAAVMQQSSGKFSTWAGSAELKA